MEENHFVARKDFCRGCKKKVKSTKVKMQDTKILFLSQPEKPTVVHSVHFDIYTCLKDFNPIFKTNIIVFPPS